MEFISLMQISLRSIAHIVLGRQCASRSNLGRVEEVVGGRIGHFDCNPNANDSFLCVKNKLAGIVNSHEEKSFAGKLRYVTD
jgi:hypothetical protein